MSLPGIGVKELGFLRNWGVSEYSVVVSWSSSSLWKYSARRRRRPNLYRSALTSMRLTLLGVGQKLRFLPKTRSSSSLSLWDEMLMTGTVLGVLFSSLCL